jgi:hypothetical protein
VANADNLSTQLTLLVDGSIAQHLVRGDPSMARAAKEAAQALLGNAGVDIDAAGMPRRAETKREPPSPGKRKAFGRQPRLSSRG